VCRWSFWNWLCYGPGAATHRRGRSAHCPRFDFQVIGDGLNSGHFPGNLARARLLFRVVDKPAQLDVTAERIHVDIKAADLWIAEQSCFDVSCDSFVINVRARAAMLRRAGTPCARQSQPTERQTKQQTTPADRMCSHLEVPFLFKVKSRWPVCN